MSYTYPSQVPSGVNIVPEISGINNLGAPSTPWSGDYSNGFFITGPNPIITSIASGYNLTIASSGNTSAIVLSAAGTEEMRLSGSFIQLASGISIVNNVSGFNNLGTLTNPFGNIFSNSGIFVSKVGIGIYGPEAPLDVSGTMLIRNSGTFSADNSPFAISVLPDSSNTAVTAMYIYPRDSASHRLFLGRPNRSLYSVNFTNTSNLENFPPNIQMIGIADSFLSDNVRKVVEIRNNANPGGDIILSPGNEVTTPGFLTAIQNGTNGLTQIRWKSYVQDSGLWQGVGASGAYSYDTNANLVTTQHSQWLNSGNLIMSLGGSGNLTTYGNIAPINSGVATIGSQAKPYQIAYIDILSGNAVNAMARAWVHFSGVGGITVGDSYGVSSVLRNAAGDYTINWTLPFKNDMYCCVADAGGGAATNFDTSVAVQSGASVRITTNNLVGLTDAGSVNVTAFGRF